MRKPIPQIPDQTPEEAESTIRAKASAAQKMIEGASIKSKTSTTDEPGADTSNNIEETVTDENNVLNDLLGGTIDKYSKESNVKKNFSVALNFYEKGALYTLAKRDQVKMQSFFQDMGIKAVVKKAEAVGFNAEIAKKLHDAGLIK